MATAPLADRYKVVQLSTLAGTIYLSKAGDLRVRIYPSSEILISLHRQGRRGEIQRETGMLFFANDAFGVTSQKFISEVLKDQGVEIVADETFNGGDRDFRTQLTKILQAKPDVLMCSAYYEDGAQIGPGEAAWFERSDFGEDGWFGPIAGIAGDALKNLYFANVSFGPGIRLIKSRCRISSRHSRNATISYSI